MSDTDSIAATVKLIASLGRQDAYLRYTPPKNAAARGDYVSVTKPLTDAVIDGHLNGGPFVGIYPVPAGSKTTRLAVFDLDNHGGTVSWEVMTEAAMRLRKVALKNGVHALPVRSGGGNGIHLEARWDEGVPARDVRALAERIVTEAGFKVGTGSITKGEVEIFPAQDEVGEKEYGNGVALPFARKSVPLDPDMRPVDSPWSPWDASRRPPAAPERAKRVGGDDTPRPIEDVVAALAVIVAGDDRERWIGVGMATHGSTGGSDEGLAAWDEWSRRFEKYREGEPARKWRGFRRDEGGLGWGSLMRWAEEGLITAASALSPTSTVDELLRRIASVPLAAAGVRRVLGVVKNRTKIPLGELKRDLKPFEGDAARDRNRRERVSRGDARPAFEAPAIDAEWLPVMAALNNVLGEVAGSEPPMRDVAGFATEVSVRRAPGLHTLTPRGANAEDADEKPLPAPELPLLSRLSEIELAEQIERHVAYTDGDGRLVHLGMPFVKHYLRRPNDPALPIVRAVSSLPLVRPAALPRQSPRPRAARLRRRRGRRMPRLARPRRRRRRAGGYRRGARPCYLLRNAKPR
jgi:hypothetical protein